MRRAALALCLAGCRDPTQITLEITTDVPCGDVTATTITAGVIETLEGAEISTDTTTCLDGRIGSLVLVPTGDDEAAIGFRVVTAVDGRVEACLAPGYDTHCIVARRSLRYLPHTPLLLPIAMSERCLGNPCGPSETCVQGECRPAEIDPERCVSGSGCGEDMLPPGDGEPPPFEPAQWARSFGGDGFDRALGLVADNDGVYASGAIEGASDVDLGGEEPGSTAGVDGFAAAYDAGGAYRWEQRFSGPATQIVNALALDERGVLSAAGGFEIELMVGVLGARASGSMDLFELELAADGVLDTGSLLVQGGAMREEATAVARGTGGTSFATGTARGRPSFPGTTDFGGDDAYVVRHIGPVVQWARRFGDTGPDISRAVGADGLGGCYVAGAVTGNVSYGPGSTSTGDGNFDGFVVAFDSAGEVRWVRAFVDGSASEARAIAIDGTGNVNVAGWFDDDIDLGGGSLGGAGGKDIFVASYGSDGTHQWSAALGGPGDDQAFGIAVDETGNVYLTGRFESSLAIGDEVVLTTPAADGFIASFMPDGSFRYAERLTVSGGSVGNAIAVSAGVVYVAGEHQGTVDFGLGDVLSAGGTDAFVLARSRLNATP